MIGKIYISGLIGSLENEKGVELIDVISQVRKQPDATSFEVYINSEGGVVDTGFDIYNYLVSLGLPITTIGSGMVASIATVIFMSGQKRLVAPNTQFMIHLPMGGISYATAEEMEMYSKEMKDVENTIVTFYSKNLTLGKEAITPLLRNETWLTESQLVDLGFVTSSTELQIAARAIIKNKIETRNKMSLKSKLQEFLAQYKEEPVVNKTIYTADEKELVFPELPEDGVIEPGVKGTYDGMPAEGEIVGQDGLIYVFVSGMLEDIKEPMTEEETVDEITIDEVAEGVLTALEIATELNSKFATMEEEITGLKTERDEAKENLAKAQETIAKLKGASKSPELEDKKEKEEVKTNVSSAVAQWKQRKNLKK